MAKALEMEVTKSYYDANDITVMLGVSTRKAYYIISQMNKELEKSGAFTVAGKVNKHYFQKRWNGQKG